MQSALFYAKHPLRNTSKQLGDLHGCHLALMLTHIWEVILENYETPQTLKHMLFSFKGRLNRKTYWFWHLQWFVGFCCWLVVQFGVPQLLFENDYGFWGVVFLSCSLPVTLCFVWCSAALSVKRCHDFDLSGWYALWLLFPFLGTLVFIVFGCVKSGSAPNRYGKVPPKSLVSHRH